MSLASGTIAAKVEPVGFPRPARLLPFAIAAALLSFLMLREPLLATWTSGAFVDTDDAMHLVEVRALLRGQGWFDMTAYGLNPPSGTFMHWSRIVDVPVALMIKGFGVVADVTTAERLARLAFPFTLLVGLYLAMARLGTLLLGPRARLPAIAATLLSGDGIIQFLPGRIDHHAPQVLALVAMLAAAVAALDPAKARQAALAGGLAGLSLAISLEDLPFIAVLAMTLVGFWIWHGAAMARMLAWYAAGLAIGLPLLFVATVAPSRYLLPVCDGYGAAHLGAGLIAAAGCASAALCGLRLPGKGARLAAALAVGALAAAFVALAYPACLHDPFAAVDPLVRDIWIRNVAESLPVLRVLRENPAVALVSTVPVALGLAFCLAAAWRRPGLDRQRFALVIAVVGVGLALSFWQVRVLTSVTAIALCGALYAAVPLASRLERHGRNSLAALAQMLIVPFTATAVALVLPVVLPGAPRAARSQPVANGDLCLTSEALAPLAQLAPGRVIAPIDLGSYLLAQTDMSVFAAAFHRDNDGNRFVFETMMASLDEAERMAVRRDAAYVMVCPEPMETALLARRAPHGLAAELLAGRVPAWLAPVPLAATPIKVYRVLRATAR